MDLKSFLEFEMLKAFPVYDDADKIIGFVFEKSFGFEPSFRKRIPGGNEHRAMPSCASLSLAIAAVKHHSAVHVQAR